MAGWPKGLKSLKKITSSIKFEAGVFSSSSLLYIFIILYYLLSQINLNKSIKEGNKQIKKAKRVHLSPLIETPIKKFIQSRVIFIMRNTQVPELHLRPKKI